MSIFTHFGCLDELAQVIYQSVHRFVVLSNVTETEWNVHLGLAESNGRWWRGRWTQDDVERLVGAKASETVIEAFADQLRDAIVGGEMFVSNWKLDKGASNIHLTLNPGSSKAAQLLLHEIEPSEAATFATNVFLEIALQAQERGCRLHPSPYATSIIPAAPPSQAKIVGHVEMGAPGTERIAVGVPAKDDATRVESRTRPPPELERKIRPTGSKEKGGASRASDKAATDSGTKGKGKGGSLANPNKKARKYQAIEFESDEE